MLDEVRLLDEIDRMTYDLLWSDLSDLEEEELDWRPHPQANSVRWILGHLVWHEEWTTDAVDDRGRYWTDTKPGAYRISTLEELRELFDRARERYALALESLAEDDLARPLDAFGRFVTVRHALRTHTTHLAGGRFQIRYARGTRSRAMQAGTCVPDPWLHPPPPNVRSSIAPLRATWLERDTTRRGGLPEGRRTHRP